MAEARRLSYCEAYELAQGRVYVGQTARRIGLVDEIGTLHDAIVAAKISAGLNPDDEVDLMILPEPPSMFERLFGDSAASAKVCSLLPEGSRVVRRAATLRQVLSQRILMWMPYGAEIR